MVLYAHGTTAGPHDVPSQLLGGYQVALAYAAMGFATAAPDFLGLGDSRGFHPYVHAATEASASFDMINASVEWLEFNDPDWDPNYLFLTGYSQGGHVSAALHRELETFWSVIYPVTAATHMSGPYSISGVMRDQTLSDESYGFPAYIAYIVLGYQEVYGTLYDTISDVFKEPFATPIAQFRNDSIDLLELNTQLIALLSAEGDTIVKRMFQDSILERVINDPNDVFNVALADNDVYAWAPLAPTRLYYCGGDKQVPFQNALVAEEAMLALGAPDVQAVNQGPTLDHGPCVIPAVTSSIAFFQSFLEPSSIADLPRNPEHVTLVPNPANDIVFVQWELARDGMTYELYTMLGQKVAGGTSASNQISVYTLAPGMYTLVCTAGDETRLARLIRI
jgi:hypothetical protein